ncbi:MAG: penicillin-binding protein 1C [Chitinophagales bacterium]
MKKMFIFFITCIVLFFTLYLIFPFRPNIEYSTLVTGKDGVVLKAFLTSDDKWRMKTELDEITPEMQKAIIYKEDKYFYYHFGVNPFAILRAAWNNIISGHRTSGASTITMQVARLIEPKERTVGNKCVEMFRAMQLELQYSKQEILQMYLNLVPYGGNIEGVKAASVLYLQKTPSMLSIAELAALSIIPNRPTSLRPGENNDVIVRERNAWLQKFSDAGLFEKDEIETAMHEPFTAFRTHAADIAPHFCSRLRYAFPDKPNIRTTLDIEKQKTAEQLVSEHVKSLWNLDIHNGAALIVDNKTHTVLAYVGSADFYNTSDGGQVDGVRAIRSPGSTLKPLLYALAFDKGLATTQTIMSDVPVNFEGYTPDNYDEMFHGNVSVEYALSNSLNIPAVKMLHELGTKNFNETLTSIGFQTIGKQKNKLGLSTILGGCGVTLEELTMLYCSFANEGYYNKLYWLENSADTSSIQIISDVSAFMLGEILQKLERPDYPAAYLYAKDAPVIAWKTGTSYGRKDAWSIGYNDRYTIGVWLGNFSGRGVPELSGANVATPLLFNLFNAIDEKANEDWNKMPENAGFRFVCSHSGKIPADFCDETVMDHYIPGVSVSSLCDHQITIKISADEKLSYCSACCPASGFKEKQFQNYTPEILAWMQGENLPYEPIPDHNSDCERVFITGAPQIVSPVSSTEYVVDPADHEKIMLACNTSADVTKIYWYLNDTLFAQAYAGVPVFFEPAKGITKISCIDDKGRSTILKMKVDFW